jgi:hypothetical protein
VSIGLKGVMLAVGSTRHSTASSERDDRELQKTEQDNAFLRAENSRLNKERNALYFVADELREMLNEAREHHETKTTKWCSQIENSNLKMSIAVACIPNTQEEVKKLLVPIEVPVTEKKPRLTASYLMEQCCEHTGLTDLQRPLPFEDAASYHITPSQGTD